MAEISNISNFKNLLSTLRSELNPDCLVTIFEHLSVLNLLEICWYMDTKDDTFFTELTRRAIGLKQWDFIEIMDNQSKWTMMKMFKVFGPWMKRIEVWKSLVLWFLHLWLSHPRYYWKKISYKCLKFLTHFNFKYVRHFIPNNFDFHANNFIFTTMIQHQFVKYSASVISYQFQLIGIFNKYIWVNGHQVERMSQNMNNNSFV